LCKTRWRVGFTKPAPIDNADHTGSKQIFDGETLNGWDGNKNTWRVEDGAIVAVWTCENVPHLAGRATR